MPQIALSYNFQSILLGLGSVKTIPEDFQIKRGMYPQLKQNHSELEFVIDILNILVQQYCDSGILSTDVPDEDTGID